MKATVGKIEGGKTMFSNKTRHELYKKFYDQYESWDIYDKALKIFTENKGHRKAANDFAREHKELRGYLIFPHRQGGIMFYDIDEGLAEETGSFDLFLKYELGIDCDV